MGTLIIGILALLYGFFTLYLRLFKNGKGLGKLEAMKKTYGEKGGTVIHVIAYTVLPLVIGVLGIAGYFLGVKLL